MQGGYGLPRTELDDSSWCRVLEDWAWGIDIVLLRRREVLDERLSSLPDRVSISCNDSNVNEYTKFCQRYHTV